MTEEEQALITAITAQRRNPERVNIFVNGEFRCGAACEVVLREGLRPGAIASGEMLCRLAAADNRWKAKESALSLLAARQRSRGELIDRLRRKSFDDDATGYAIAEVERLGLVDDVAFAEAWVRDRLRLRPRGARALVAELSHKRISAEVAAAVVERVMKAEHADENELCMEAALKWSRTRGVSAGVGSDVIRTQRRLNGFLARRGFSLDAIRKAVRAATGR